MFLVYLDAVSCEKPQFVVWVIEDGRAVEEKLRTGNAVIKCVVFANRLRSSRFVLRRGVLVMLANRIPLLN